MKRLKNYVNGEWVEPGGVSYLDVENPSSGAVIAEVPLSTADDVEKAVAAARAAFPNWSSRPDHLPQAILLK